MDILTCLLAACGLVSVCVSEKYRRERNKLKNEKKQLEKDYRNQLAIKAKEYSTYRLALDGMTEKLWTLLRIGHKHIEKRYKVGVVEVVGYMPEEPDFAFVIKKFVHDQTDKEEYDFANREADELIEKLQEK